MNYPKRGEMSEDGKYYTHTDGTVFKRKPCPFNLSPNCKTCGGPFSCKWLSRIEGAYVPSADEQEACDMAREHIEVCSGYRFKCIGCPRLNQRMCPLRAYLAAHGDANAWEVTP